MSYSIFFGNFFQKLRKFRSVFLWRNYFGGISEREYIREKSPDILPCEIGGDIAVLVIFPEIGAEFIDNAPFYGRCKSDPRFNAAPDVPKLVAFIGGNIANGEFFSRPAQRSHPVQLEKTVILSVGTVSPDIPARPLIYDIIRLCHPYAVTFRRMIFKGNFFMIIDI